MSRLPSPRLARPPATSAAVAAAAAAPPPPTCPLVAKVLVRPAAHAAHELGGCQPVVGHQHRVDGLVAAPLRNLCIQLGRHLSGALGHAQARGAVAGGRWGRRQARQAGSGQARCGAVEAARWYRALGTNAATTGGVSRIAACHAMHLAGLVSRPTMAKRGLSACVPHVGGCQVNRPVKHSRQAEAGFPPSPAVLHVWVVPTCSGRHMTCSGGNGRWRRTAWSVRSRRCPAAGAWQPPWAAPPPLGCRHRRRRQLLRLQRRWPWARHSAPAGRGQ